MPTFMDDLDVVDPNTVESTGPLYPVAQWLNGDPKLAALGGIAHTGGLIIPAKYLDDNVTPAPGWTRANVAFSSGKTEAVLAAQKAMLAVIRVRFRWFVRTNGVETYYPRTAYVANSNMRGHVQALCGIRGYNFPVVVTFKGKASQEFEALLRYFSQKTREAARKINPGANFPRFAFYMWLSPGPHIKAGQKGQESTITPPVLELPADLSADALNKLYVGREALMQFQQVHHDNSEWAGAWDQSASDDEHADDFDEQPPSERADPDTGEITDAEPPAPANGQRKAATLNVTGARWLQLVRALAKKHPHYQDSSIGQRRGQPDNARILAAALKEGYAEITNANMDAVIEALDRRENAKAALYPAA